MTWPRCLISTPSVLTKPISARSAQYSKRFTQTSNPNDTNNYSLTATSPWRLPITSKTISTTIDFAMSKLFIKTSLKTYIYQLITTVLYVIINTLSNNLLMNIQKVLTLCWSYLILLVKKLWTSLMISLWMQNYIENIKKNWLSILIGMNKRLWVLTRQRLLSNYEIILIRSSLKMLQCWQIILLEWKEKYPIWIMVVNKCLLRWLLRYQKRWIWA